MNGLSTTITHAGFSFLIQTQDSGPRAHFLETLFYRSGRLVYSRRTSYTTILDDPNRDDRLMCIVRDQHQNVLDDAVAGRLDAHLLKP
jgi:hypothetical protein